MAQTGYTPILLYSSTTPSQAPAAGNLTNSTLGSEVAINITDGKLFYKDNTNAVQVIAWKTTPTTAGGTGLTSYTAGDLLYYATGSTLTKLGIGSNGQILTSSGTAPQWTTLSGVAVTTFSAGTTGFTPSVATSGAVTLAGTLATTNGGTGLTSFTANRVFYASSTSAIGSSANLTFNGTTLTANDITDSSLTATRVTYAGTGGNLVDSANLTFNGTTLTSGGYSTGGNLTFTGTGNRITGDFSNATLANRVAFQTSTTNGNTIVGVLPNGTSTAAAVHVYGASDPTNTSRMDLVNAGTDVRLASSITGTGTYIPMTFITGGSERARIFTSGGVSIGNTTDPGATNLSVSGNVVIATSGKGIDFSATAGTGTSELLADYEEGDWTPNQGGGLTVTGTFASTGKYTKIGRNVTVIAEFTATSISCTANGDITTNLPFTAGVGLNASGTMITATQGHVIYGTASGSSVRPVLAVAGSAFLVFTMTYMTS